MNRVWNYFLLRVSQLSRDVQSLVLAFFLPVISLLAVGYMTQKSAPEITINYSIKTDDVARERAIVTALANASQGSGLVFKVSDSDVETMRMEVLKSKLSFFLQISAKDGEKAELLFSRLENNNAVVALAVGRVLAKALPGITFSRQQVSAAGNTYLSTFFPGMLAFTIAMLGMAGFGGYVIQDRDRGVLKKLKTIDNRPYSYLYGIMMSRAVVVLALFGIYVALGFWLFNYRIQGSLALALALVVLLSWSMLAFGLFIVTITKSIEAYSGWANLLQVGFVLTSGAFFSLDSLPSTVRGVLAVSPLSAFISGFQVVAEPLAGQDMATLLPSFAVLALWGAVLFPLSLSRFKW